MWRCGQTRALHGPTRGLRTPALMNLIAATWCPAPHRGSRTCGWTSNSRCQCTRVYLGSYIAKQHLLRHSVSVLLTLLPRAYLLTGNVAFVASLPANRGVISPSSVVALSQPIPCTCSRVSSGMRYSNTISKYTTSRANKSCQAYGSNVPNAALYSFRRKS